MILINQVFDFAFGTLNLYFRIPSTLIAVHETKKSGFTEW